jgi:chemotaxis methyl-accepting protein methylase
MDAVPGPAMPSDSDFRGLSAFIEGELGIRMPDTERIMLESRLRKRLRRFAFSSEGRESELINVIDAVTTSKTDFFREATYDESKVEAVPIGFKKKYMLQSEAQDRSIVRLKPEIRARVSSERINFMDAKHPLSAAFDIAFCRNMIIRFERAIQEAVLKKLRAHIRFGGWLILGHSAWPAGEPI